MALKQEKHRSPRNVTLMMDGVHIVLGFLIVVMAVAAFLNPEGNMALFPIIFFLAMVLNLLNGIHRYSQSGRDKKKKIMSIGQLAVAVFLLVISVISAVSIWG